MRRLLVAAVAAAALGSVPAAASATDSRVACTRAVIAGQSKCIARGQFCARNSRAMRDYRKYGLTCTKRDVNGRYHLQ